MSDQLSKLTELVPDHVTEGGLKLSKRGALANILSTGLRAMEQKATQLGAKEGAGGVGVLTDGRLYTNFAPLHDDWSLAFAGTNHLSFAMGEMALISRTLLMLPENDESDPSFWLGEHQSNGVAFDTLFVEDADSGCSTVLFATYSGSSSFSNQQVAIAMTQAMHTIVDKMTSDDD